MMKTAYGRATAVANETIAAIKTVTAFGRQRVEFDKYVANLNEAEVAGRQKGKSAGLARVCTTHGGVCRLVCLGAPCHFMVSLTGVTAPPPLTLWVRS